MLAVVVKRELSTEASDRKNEVSGLILSYRVRCDSGEAHSKATTPSHEKKLAEVFQACLKHTGEITSHGWLLRYRCPVRRAGGGGQEDGGGGIAPCMRQ